MLIKIVCLKTRTMKNLTKALLLALSLLLFSNGKLKSQTAVNLVAYDSTASLCSLPVNSLIHYYGSAFGYTIGVDSIQLHFYFGDGTDTVFYKFLAVSSYFSAPPDISHTYNLPGAYPVMIIATGPDGNADTINYSILCGASCGNVNGYTYIDNNNDCVFDSGDDTLRCVTMNLYDGSGNYIQSSFSDNNGYYDLTIPTGLTYTLEAAIPASFATGLTPSCPVSGSTTFTLSGTISNDFGFICSTTDFDLSCSLISANYFFVPGNPSG
jgi:SdrD B-like domain